MSQRHLKRARQSPGSRPDVFTFHDHRIFLAAWTRYLRESERGLSIRGLAREAGISPAYLPLVIAGKRNLSEDMLNRLAPHLGLGTAELAFLLKLTRMSSPGSVEEQARALSRMTHSRTYKKRNPGEVEFFEYMSRWYHIAIREMASFADFSTDPAWIRDRLRKVVPLSEVKRAVEFLLKRGYLQTDRAGGVTVPKELLKCDDTVHSKTLRYYHKQMLALAAESMSATPSEERYLFGYSFSLDSKNLTAVTQILERAVREIEALERKQVERDAIYHVELALFPLTQKRGGK